MIIKIDNLLVFGMIEDIYFAKNLLIQQTFLPQFIFPKKKWLEIKNSIHYLVEKDSESK